MQNLYGVELYESVPSWPSGTHEVQVYAFGAPTLEEANARAAIERVKFEQRTGRAHRADVHAFCVRCRVTRKEPGYKRKPCSRCGGTGRVPMKGSDS